MVFKYRDIKFNFLLFFFLSIFLCLFEKGLAGDHFRFDGNGDGPARYNIIHFKQIRVGKYDWVKVGEYNEGELSLDMEGEYMIQHDGNLN